MAMTKFMSRIVAPDLSHESVKVGEAAIMLHDHTYGITSDPLTHFACAFSALVHDADHPGVPNTGLVLENSSMVAVYNNRSVAQQNSVDLAWNLLMDSRCRDFRHAIYGSNSATQKRFRQLVVNSVMATDIIDKDLKVLRNSPREKAFPPKATLEEADSPNDAVDRKATIVIEHAIQASDIAHIMQRWHVYRKWNEKLVREMHTAYKGRAEKNPAEFWHKGEIGFLGSYVIPSARKLNDCGVFGVSCAECLDYAMKNREEWEKRGQQVVEEMLRSLEE